MKFHVPKKLFSLRHGRFILGNVLVKCVFFNDSQIGLNRYSSWWHYVVAKQCITQAAANFWVLKYSRLFVIKLQTWLLLFYNLLFGNIYRRSNSCAKKLFAPCIFFKIWLSCLNLCNCLLIPFQSANRLIQIYCEIPSFKYF